MPRKALKGLSDIKVFEILTNTASSYSVSSTAISIPYAQTLTRDIQSSSDKTYADDDIYDDEEIIDVFRKAAENRIENDSRKRAQLICAKQLETISDANEVLVSCEKYEKTFTDEDLKKIEPVRKKAIDMISKKKIEKLLDDFHRLSDEEKKRVIASLRNDSNWK